MVENRMLAFGMPAPFTPQDVLKIASLANLQLEPDEIELYARQLGEFLAYANEVQEADTAGVPPTAAVGSRLVPDRGDDPKESLDISRTLANAPDADHSQHQGGFFKVPRVIG
jgi:aspartyl-tRNA(Asn)/glutamyl-tRNA(Gln) amidotransferase subunit C